MVEQQVERWAVIHSSEVERVKRYLPRDYFVRGMSLDQSFIVISGRDNAGWTLDNYVLPRLASGLLFGEEVFWDEEAGTTDIFAEQDVDWFS